MVVESGYQTHGCLHKQPIYFASQTSPDFHKSINPSRWKLRYFILKKLSLLYYDIYHQEHYNLKQLSHVEMGDLCLTVNENSGYKIILEFLDGKKVTFF